VGLEEKAIIKKVTSQFCSDLKIKIIKVDMERLLQGNSGIYKVNWKSNRPQ
jgi:hypothetical protein